MIIYCLGTPRGLETAQQSQKDNCNQAGARHDLPLGVRAGEGAESEGLGVAYHGRCCSQIMPSWLSEELEARKRGTATK